MKWLRKERLNILKQLKTNNEKVPDVFMSGTFCGAVQSLILKERSDKSSIKPLPFSKFKSEHLHSYFYNPQIFHNISFISTTTLWYNNKVIEFIGRRL
jgi:hypothetical protein